MRYLMLLKNNFKLFYRNIFFTLVPILILIYFATIILEGNSLSSAGNYLGEINYVGLILGQFGLAWFTYFIFVSYEFFNKVTDRKIFESLNPNQYLRNFLSQCSVLCIIGIACFIVSSAIVVSFMLLKTPEISVLIPNTLISSALYILLPIILGISIGGALTKLHRIPFYSIATAIIFLVSPFSLNFTLSFEYLISDIFGVNLGLIISDFFNMFQNIQPVYNSTVNIAMGQGIDIFRWFLLLATISLFIVAIIFNFVKHKSKYILFTATLLFSFICFFNYFSLNISWQQHAVSDISNNISSDMYYYSTQSYDSLETSDFKILSYNMEISIFENLSVIAEIKIDNIDIEELTFTLYHHYKIDSIKSSSGEYLSFSQSGDQFTVENIANNDVLIITYAGNSDTYYSTVQGAYLPSFFGFYPIEGTVPLYNYTSLQFDNSLKNNDIKSFEIEIHANFDVFTNLDSVGQNLFSGNANEIFIVGGVFEEINNEIFPSLFQKVDVLTPIKNVYESYSNILNLETTFPVINHIIYSPSISLPQKTNSSVLSLSNDNLYLPFMFGSETEYTELAINLILDPLSINIDKILYNEFETILRSISEEGTVNIPTFESLFPNCNDEDYTQNSNLNEYENHIREIQFYFHKSIEKYGVSYVANITYNFLSTSNSDELEFIKAIYRGEV